MLPHTSTVCCHRRQQFVAHFAHELPHFQRNRHTVGLLVLELFRTERPGGLLEASPHSREPVIAVGVFSASTGRRNVGASRRPGPHRSDHPVTSMIVCRNCSRCCDNRVNTAGRVLSLLVFWCQHSGPKLDGVFVRIETLAVLTSCTVCEPVASSSRIAMRRPRPPRLSEDTAGYLTHHLKSPAGPTPCSAPTRSLDPQRRPRLPPSGAQPHDQRTHRGGRPEPGHRR